MGEDKKFLNYAGYYGEYEYNTEKRTLGRKIDIHRRMYRYKIQSKRPSIVEQSVSGSCREIYNLEIKQ